MFADNPDFYPTPRPIARRMLAKITNKEAKYYLEPSAGKGDIADVIKQPYTFEEFSEENPGYATKRSDEYFGPRWSDRENSRIHVDVIENYPDLISVLHGKGFDVVGYDWLTYQGVSYYDAIVMNPPYSEGAKHLLKAWEFLHNGEIVCLLNEETIKNPYTEERKRLVQIIEAFGNVEYLGDCFSTAEHKTSVNVAMVYLKKVAVDDAPDLWAKEATREKNYTAEFDGDPTMLAIRDNLGNMEHWFNMANEHWCKGIEHIRKARLYMDQNKVSDSRDRVGSEEFKTILGIALNNVQTCRAEYLRRHRRLAWTSVFQQMEFGKWLDSKQQERFMRDVERDSTIPFTAENIKNTLENVFMSRKKLFDESVANVFDELCSHAVENGSGPVAPSSLRNRRSEGWKTNDSYKVNQRLIFPYAVEMGFSGYLRQRGYGSGSSAVVCNDLDRILCVFDGKPFDKCYTVGAAVDRARPGQLVESQYFEIRGYKKGTLHLKWKRLDLWERFNVTAAAGKKWLGEDTQQYRPTKRKTGADIPWECRDSHTFVDGVCSRCNEPEIDELEAVECEWCRAIFEHTGVKHCPIHQEDFMPMLAESDTNINTELFLEAAARGELRDPDFDEMLYEHEKDLLAKEAWLQKEVV
jgi:hypothetical protein